MNVKKPSLATPLVPKVAGSDQVQAQDQFKSNQNPGKPGKNGVILHLAGCHGNHLGKC